MIYMNGERITNVGGETQMEYCRSMCSRHWTIMALTLVVMVIFRSIPGQSKIRHVALSR